MPKLPCLILNTLNKHFTVNNIIFSSMIFLMQPRWLWPEERRRGWGWRDRGWGGLCPRDLYLEKWDWVNWCRTKGKTENVPAGNLDHLTCHTAKTKINRYKSAKSVSLRSKKIYIVTNSSNNEQDGIFFFKHFYYRNVLPGGQKAQIHVEITQNTR